MHHDSQLDIPMLRDSWIAESARVTPWPIGENLEPGARETCDLVPSLRDMMLPTERVSERDSLLPSLRGSARATVPPSAPRIEMSTLHLPRAHTAPAALPTDLPSLAGASFRIKKVRDDQD
jgi:hypothetical protein